MIGHRLLHYEIVARIGAGGMGEVWRAYDSRLERDVAIKILPADAGLAPVLRERFVREARAASALGHPNIITVHEINSADDRDFIVMEYVRGETLAQLLAHGGLPVAQALDYAVQIAGALEAAHAAGVIHRDLKPGNIMIASSGLVKVLDFGIAKRLSDGASDSDLTTTPALTVAGATLGTPAYMSPEQILGDPVDARSDLFSFGVVLYQMLAGGLPFKSTTALGLVREIVHEPPRPLTAAAPHVPAAVAALVDQCLAKDPESRVASAAALREQLRRVSALLPEPPAVSPDAETQLVPSPPETRRAPAPVRTATLAAGALLVLFLLWHQGSRTVEWLRTPSTRTAEAGDVGGTPQELLARATEHLRLHYREGNVDLAIRELEQALSERSPYPAADARLSLAYWRKNHLSPDSEWQKRARAHAERSVAADEQLAAAHLALGAASMLTGELDEAAAAFRRAEALDPGNWELRWRLGDLALARKDPAAAEPHYRQATASGADEWEAHGVLGVFLYRQGRYTEAVDAFERMRELAPDHARAYSNLAAAYHQIGRTHESARLLQRAIEFAPDSQTYSNLGTYLYFEGKYPEAERAFDAALALNANAYRRWGNLADAVRMTAPGSEKMHQSYRRAIQLAREELENRPHEVAIRSSVALYLARDGQLPAAKEEVDRILARPDVPPSVLFNAALVRELGGERASALHLLTRALDAGYQLREVRAEPDLVTLRADPEYHRIVSRFD